MDDILNTHVMQIILKQVVNECGRKQSLLTKIEFFTNVALTKDCSGRCSYIA